MTLPELLRKVNQWRVLDKKIAFTNGCFDILHAGHIASLTEASMQADYLVVAINADISIKGLKGDNRPVNDENARAKVIAALSMVDAVIIFSEPTPRELIVEIRPDVLVKGGDYKVEEIAGAKEVMEWGGKIVLNPIIEGYSTTSIINKLQNK
ncbi:MAG TPA: D-glycero-beta-D-manno-heptose 1-phosphate adenylyltransferase [Flavisolibacter sp.]|nr:D-glycero-beta-D-manno-heptose 1-phosphate adenylyltransferase [Flavisolibacter sp.]